MSTVDRHLGRRGRRIRPPSRLTGTVLLGAAVLLVAIAVAGQTLYSSASRLNRDEQFGTNHIDPAVVDSVRLLVTYVDEESGLRGYLLHGEAVFLQPVEAAQQVIPRLESQLAGNVDAISGAGSALAGVISAHDAWENGFVVPELALVASGDLAQAQQIAETPLGKQLFDTIRQRFVPLQSLINGAQASNQDHVRGIENRLILLLILTLVAFGLLIGMGTWVLVRRITQPVDRMTAEAAALAAGHARPPPGQRRFGDFQRLGEYTETIRSQLAAHRLHSRRATEALVQQGPSVAALVAALEPRRESVARLATSARIDPAEGLLAGDWFDLLAVGEQTLAIVVGDVSGHGPASAVFALRLRELLMAFLLEGLPPDEVLSRTAKANEQGADELFATIFCAVVDTGIGTLRYANAGHPPAVMHRGRADAPAELLVPTGPLLSPIVSGAHWWSQTQNFLPGCGLLVVTDGVTESQCRDGTRYGLDRITRDLFELFRVPPESVADHLAERIDRLAGVARSDDRTLVYCRHVG